jgi:hypothetical protein
MGNGGADTQVIDGILKDYYEDFIAEQVNNRNPFKDYWRFEDVPFAGREVVYTSHISRNVSPMFVGEDSAFADAGAQGHVQVRVGQRKLMGRIRMTSEAIQDSMSSKGAFKAARKDETDGLIKDLARKEEYALCSDGRGILALCDESNPDGSVTMGVDAPGGVTNDNFGNRFIQKGMYVAFINPANGALRAGVRKVVSVSTDGTSITLDSACGATVAENDYIVQAANASVTDVLDTSYEHAFWGMLALVDDGTYRNNFFGVDRSVYGTYQSYVKASTGALSFDLMQQVSDILDQRFGVGITDLVMHHGIRRLFLNMLETDRRYTGSDLKKPDGMTAAFKQGDLTMGEVPIRVIRDWPLDVMALLNKGDSGWVCYQSEPGKWVDEDGSVLVRHGYGSAGRDAFEAWYRMRKQYHVRYPGYNARLDGITGQSFVVARAE